MRTNLNHVVRFRGVCSVFELSEKKGDKYILAAPALHRSHGLGLNQTKTTNRGRYNTNRFVPCGGRESPVGREPWQGLVSASRCKLYVCLFL